MEKLGADLQRSMAKGQRHCYLKEIKHSRTRKTGNREKGRAELHGDSKNQCEVAGTFPQGNRSRADERAGVEEPYGSSQAPQGGSEHGRGRGYAEYQGAGSARE